jgi:hypothetical protein
MLGETKKLGEMLVGAGLITPGQLQEALRHQRITGGRMGSNLVAMGYISEDLLMDFLAQQTGVPRLDVKHLNIPQSILERIPRRLAEQLVILPVAFKEPKSLVLAMADPSDLNAVDSARFASGMSIEPVVASHSALKQAIADHYRRLETSTMPVIPVVDGSGPSIEIQDGPVHPQGTTTGGRDYPKDPFFGSSRPSAPVHAPDPAGPFDFFPEAKAAPSAPARPVPPKPSDSQIIHARSALDESVMPLENYGTRSLVLGLTRILQRRGILAEGELARLLANMVEAKEIDPRE